MSQKISPANPYFWLLIAVSFSLASLGLGLSWTYSQTWIEVLWHIYHTNFQHLQTIVPLKPPRSFRLIFIGLTTQNFDKIKLLTYPVELTAKRE